MLFRTLLSTRTYYYPHSRRIQKTHTGPTRHQNNSSEYKLNIGPLQLPTDNPLQWISSRAARSRLLLALSVGSVAHSFDCTRQLSQSYCHFPGNHHTQTSDTRGHCCWKRSFQNSHDTVRELSPIRTNPSLLFLSLALPYGSMRLTHKKTVFSHKLCTFFEAVNYHTKKTK